MATISTLGELTLFQKKQLMVANNQRLLSLSGQGKQTRKHMWRTEPFNTAGRNALALKSIKIIFLHNEKSLAVKEVSEGERH